MIRFECDYGEGAAQPVLDLLQKTNLEQTPGYGMDDYCDQARGLIRKLCDAPDAGVHFFVGATQANFTVVDALLKPWQGVLCADSGHINVHETGAVEATGHKCLALPNKNGKITARQIRHAVEDHRANASHEHEVQPGMVYISNPTEVGTLYNKEELTDISAACGFTSFSQFNRVFNKFCHTSPSQFRVNGVVTPITAIPYEKEPSPGSTKV